MKKVLFIGAVFGALALTSCKKDYVCECQYTNEAKESKTIEKYDLTKTKKRDAQSQCDYKEDSYNSMEGFTAHCKIQ